MAVRSLGVIVKLYKLELYPLPEEVRAKPSEETKVCVCFIRTREMSEYCRHQVQRCYVFYI